MRRPALDTTQAAQHRQLVAARRRATGLLAAVAVLLVASAALPDTTLVGYVRAMLEAGLVGGLADWFAVVALFRHPLGVPIPHTAVIPKSKDGLGANLAGFVEENFLDEGDLVDRLARPEVVTRFGTWLQEPDTATRLAGQVARLLRGITEAVDDDELVDRTAAAVRERVLALPLPELAGRTLEQAIRDQRHRTAVSAVIDGIRQAIQQNRQALRVRLGKQSPGWVPPIVDDLVFDRGEEVVVTFLRELAADEDHELRRALDEQLLALTVDLQDGGDLTARVDEAVEGVLTPELATTWVRSWLDQLQARLDRAVDDPADPLRERLAVLIVTAGERLVEDDDLRARVLGGLRDAAPTLARVGQREITSLVAATVDRWDADETSTRLELWLGRDLQFVRINGTLVGGGVGLVLHAITRSLGI